MNNSFPSRPSLKEDYVTAYVTSSLEPRPSRGNLGYEPKKQRVDADPTWNVLPNRSTP